MEFVDVVFPQNLKPLTYRVPAELRDVVRPGSLVEAPLKRSRARGVIYRPAEGPAPARLRGLTCIVEDREPLGEDLLKLLHWMSDYYFANEGSVLKGMLPEEFFRPVKPRRSRRKTPTPATIPSFAEAARDSDCSLVDAVAEAARTGGYRTFLLEAPTTGYEFSFLAEVLRQVPRALVLVPERAEADALAGPLQEALGAPVETLHGGMSAGARTRALRALQTGDTAVAIGSRQAVFAPLAEPSLIVVLHEESPAYKAEGGVRYLARDVAVMRGFLGGLPVLLSSICPSAESVMNVQKGKYTLLSGGAARLAPRVRVVGIGRPSAVLSRTLRRAVESRVAAGRKVLLYVNRRGYSLLECAECGHLEHCHACGVPVMFSKSARRARCGCCGAVFPPPERCPACGGSGLGPAGAGMERVEEEIRSLRPVGVEKRTRDLLRVVAEAEDGLAVGTKVLTRSALLREEFDLVGVVNADAYRWLPDFRATERAFQDLRYAVDRVRPGGELILQTRRPGASLFRHLRKPGSRSFHREEFREREALGYPPFSRLVLLIVAAEDPPPLGRPKGVRVLGPVESRGRRGRRIWKTLLVGASREALRSAVVSLLDRLGGDGVTVDVDPVSVEPR